MRTVQELSHEIIDKYIQDINSVYNPPDIKLMPSLKDATTMILSPIRGFMNRDRVGKFMFEPIYKNEPLGKSLIQGRDLITELAESSEYPKMEVLEESLKRLKYYEAVYADNALRVTSRFL